MIKKDITSRYFSGPLLKEILLHMEDVATNSKPKRSYFYSAHDITIVNILRTMGFTEFLKPDYGAMLLFELHAIDNGENQEVKVLILLYLTSL
jgi:hypothetical protein